MSHSAGSSNGRIADSESAHLGSNPSPAAFYYIFINLINYNLAMLNLNSIMIGSAKPEEMAEFYKKVFNKAPDMEDNGWYGWQVGNAFFTIGEHSEVKGSAKEPQRVIFNYETKEVKKEFERIKNTHATVIKEPYEMGGAWIATFADPDGNYFQLMTPWDNIDNKVKT